MKNARMLTAGRVTLALIGLSLGLWAQAQTQGPRTEPSHSGLAGLPFGRQLI